MGAPVNTLDDMGFDCSDALGVGRAISVGYQDPALVHDHAVLNHEELVALLEVSHLYFLDAQHCALRVLRHQCHITPRLPAVCRLLLRI